MAEGYLLGKTGGGARTIQNANVGLYFTVEGTIPPNTYVELENGKIKIASRSIFGLTKTKCSAEKAGRVWIL